MAVPYTPPAFFTAPTAPPAPQPVTTELGEQELRSRILLFLNTQTQPVKTIEISKNIYGKAAKAKMVNATLYKLQTDGVLVKTAKENGGDPRWALKR